MLSVEISRSSQCRHFGGFPSKQSGVHPAKRGDPSVPGWKHQGWVDSVKSVTSHDFLTPSSQVK